MVQVKSTLEKLQKFKRKYYLNILLRGGIFTVALILSLFLIFNSLEFWLHLNKTFRQVLFFTFVLATVSSFYIFIINPLVFILNIKKQLSDEEAAALVGKKFHHINDKLINTIQLLKFVKENPLAAASLNQREVDFQNISFSTAIDYRENTRFLKYLALPVLFLAAILAIYGASIFESTTRIINYDKHFPVKAPFEFNLLTKNLKAFKDEDFTLDVKLSGRAIPDIIYLNNKDRRYKMEKKSKDSYSFTFNNLVGNETFYFEGAGYTSAEYKLNVVNRPMLFDLEAQLSYPKYLGKKNEQIRNAGNLIVPEGTMINWTLNTQYTDSVEAEVEKEKISGNKIEESKFNLSYKAVNDFEIQFNTKNEFAKNKEELIYKVDVIKDQYPEINTNISSDTILFSNIIIGGNASDDYGVSKIRLFYKKTTSGSSGKLREIKIPVAELNSSVQSFYYKWALDTINLKPGEQLEYYLQVWDNDGVNGAKSTKTQVYSLQLPDNKEIKESLSKSGKQTESALENALKTTEQIRKELNEVKEELKAKRKGSWQDQKKMEELAEKQKLLEEQIKQIQQENSAQNLQKEKFLNPNDKIMEKLKQLEKLMNNLLDEETKKLYEELQKLLKEQNQDQIPDLLEKINKKDLNLEKELERALEMFKKMEFEQKLENTVQELKELKEEQQKLSEEAQDKNVNQDYLMEKQEKLMEEFKEKEEDIEELKEMNQDLENSSPLENTEKEQNEIKQNQQKSLQDLKDNKNKKSSESQSKAAEQMQKLAEKMENMQSSMEMESQEENIAHLRDILENLLALSFDQEALMKEFKNVNQSDPRYIDLTQKQLKIKDDAKIIEDSLLSLSKRVFQIESFVTRELSSMNENIDESLDNLKKRRPSVAASKQQFAMRSMNELALLLNDVLKQMQEQMANAKGTGKNSKGKKKNSSPGLSDLQKQLNERIQSLKEGGKTGRALSEEIAELAAQQEMIRRAVEKMKKSAGKNAAGDLQQLIDQMEKTEEELVNKKTNQKTVDRQKEILTRLLESEKSQKERDMDEKREATSAKQFEKQLEEKHAEYLKAKEKEIEFLKTLPPSFNSYYKNQVNNYFKSIKN